MSLDRKAFTAPLSEFKAWFIVAGVLLVAALSAVAFDHFYTEYVRQDWEVISKTEEQRLADDIQSRFKAYVQETADATERIAELAEVREALRDTSPLPSPALFGSLIAHSDPD